MNITSYSSHINRMDSASHKGQNGKVLVIGGSELFHAASRWSLDVVSAMVDMVFYSSVPENNELIREAKQEFWDGVVVPRNQIEEYLQEADVILIGPGMTREKYVSEEWSQKLLSGCAWRTQVDGNNPPVRVRYREKVQKLSDEKLASLAMEIDWQKDTYAVVNYLVAKYPEKKWIIDAGALQMVEGALLTPSMILTPHQKELQLLFKRFENWVMRDDNGADMVVGRTQYVHYHQFFDGISWLGSENEPASSEFDEAMIADAKSVSEELNGVTILLKGKTDIVLNTNKTELVTGGNPGMTKGGTGDALAGLIAGLYCFTDDPFVASVVGSYVNKKAGDNLYEYVGPFFKTSELVKEIPHVLKDLLYAT